MLHTPITSVLYGPVAAQKGIIPSRTLAFLNGIENFYTKKVVAETTLEKQPSGSTLGQQQPSGGSATRFFCSLTKQARSSRRRFNLNNSTRKTLKTTKET